MVGEVPETSSSSAVEEKPWHSYISTDLPRTVQHSTDSAIRSARSFQHSSSTHFRALQDFMPQLFSQYRAYEDAFFLKVKDELKTAKEHPAITTGAAALMAILLARGSRRFLFRHTLGRFQSEEARFLKADKNVKEMKLSVDLMKKESGKLIERTALAEKEMNRGQNNLMNAGGQMHILARSVRKAEADATDLMDMLREIPGREALKLRAEVASMASHLREQRILMDKKMIRISELVKSEEKPLQQKKRVWMEKEEMESCRVGSVPTIYYLSDFVSRQEEQQLMDAIYKAPVTKWKTLMNRRLQNWGGIVHEKGLVAQDLPPWLTTISRKISDISGLFPSPINHVLINEYLPNQGIMPHQDGPAYYPVVAILSLGSPVVMDFSPHSQLVDAHTSSKHQPFSLLLMPRSLLIFKDDAYSGYLHGIKDNEHQQCGQVVNATQTGDEISQDDKFISRTATRVSLTCRTVMKVHKNWLRV